MDNLDEPQQILKNSVREGSILQGDNVNNVSEYERGLSVIGDILTPGSAAYDVLTEEEKKGLRSVQNILLGKNGEDLAASYIPESLRSFDPSTGSDVDKYLISQFAGFKKVSAKQTFKKLVNANIFLTGLKERASARDFSTKSSAVIWTHVPSEWDELDRETQEQVAEILSWDSLSEWGFDVFKLDRLTNGNALLFLGWGLLSSPYSQNAMQKSLSPDFECDPEDLPGYKFLDEFDIHPATMVNFLRVIQGDYIDNAYHNSTHAADVTQTLHSMLRMGGDEYASTEIQQFSLLLAAVIHDVGHPGLNNNYQIQSRSDIALQYNDSSPLEMMHISKAYSRVYGNGGDPTINIFKTMKPEQVNSIRSMVIEAVLHTDMTKHFASVGHLKTLLLTIPMEELKEDSNNSWAIGHFLLHLADISNPAKPGDLAVQWTDRCLDEFFQQGDKEKEMNLPVSPLCDRMTTDRAASQVGFIKHVVTPAFKALAGCIPEIEKVVIPCLKDNYKFWKQEQRTEEEVDL